MPDIVVFSGCWQCADSVTALFDNFRKRYFVNNRKFSPVSVSLIASLLPPHSLVLLLFSSQKENHCPRPATRLTWIGISGNSYDKFFATKLGTNQKLPRWNFTSETAKKGKVRQVWNQKVGPLFTPVPPPLL